MNIPPTYLELLEINQVDIKRRPVKPLAYKIADVRKASTINRQYIVDGLKNKDLFVVKDERIKLQPLEELPSEVEPISTLISQPVPIKTSNAVILSTTTSLVDTSNKEVDEEKDSDSVDEEKVSDSVDEEKVSDSVDEEKGIVELQQLIETKKPDITQDVIEDKVDYDDEQKDNEVQDKIEEAIQGKKKRGRKAKAKIQEFTDKNDDVDLTTAIIRGQIITDRLPNQREKNIVITPPYYMNNRKLFIQNMSKLFETRRKELLTNSETISCDRNPSLGFDLLTHQKVVRDYLNLYTPYRGLLLYHGLGSGKTCTSIAIAEGMKTDKRVFVMTPASLKTNFLSEMQKCGDDMYKKDQYWEFVSIDGKPEYIGILSKALSLPRLTIETNGGAWLVNVKKPSNMNTRTVEEQKVLDEQIAQMMHAKYVPISYNAPNLMKIVNKYSNDKTVNPFDNSVVIIDEAHNFVSRIVNKIKSPKSVSFILYDYLMNATNARIVLLSGTPIINYPNEIGILYNILRGYIKTWTIDVIVNTKERVDTNFILNKFDKANIRAHDFVKYHANKLIITRNPYGFINAKKKGALKGTKRNERIVVNNKTKKVSTKQNGGSDDEFRRYGGVRLDDTGNISDDTFIKNVIATLNAAGLELSINPNEPQLHKALPDISDKFLDTFVNAERGETKNINLFQRRILGLTSYFRSAQENLLPQYVLTDEGDNYHIVKSEMTPYQYGVYSKIRKVEADREKNSRNQAQKKPADDELFTISSTYRIFSRAACNFVFPEEIERPIPNGNVEILDENTMDIVPEEVSREADVYSNIDDEAIITEVDKNNYAKRIENALSQISIIDPETTRSKYLSINNLQMLSPKFHSILENIMNQDYRGLHLLYSHFRTIEGIGLMKLILEANGFAEFKIQKNGDSWEIVENESDKGKPTFVLYTGTETPEEKEIIRNVYNGDWNIVPVKIKNKIEERAENNMYGDVIKIFMITSSGAEGINLKNTRYVHVVEPYWHMVRVEQVVGRARRICSHQDLPEELRTVQVFLYITTLSDEQKKDEKNTELRRRDVSRIDRITPVTTDETLYEIASIKQKINNQILQSVKETAVDCTLYSKGSSNKEKPMICYGYGKVESNDFGSYPTFEMDKEYKQGSDTKYIDWDIQQITIQGIEFALNVDTNDLYTYESYEQARTNPGIEPKYVGRLVNENGAYRIVK